MYTSVNHVSFTVSSVEKAVEFYVHSLGMKLIDISERGVAFSEKVTGIPGASLRIAYLTAADFKIELIEYLTSRGEKLDTRTCNIGSAHVCFNVDELDTMYAEMSAKGVKFMSSPLTIPAGPNRGAKVVYLEDCDGNTFEFIERPNP